MATASQILSYNGQSLVLRVPFVRRWSCFAPYRMYVWLGQRKDASGPQGDAPLGQDNGLLR